MEVRFLKLSGLYLMLGVAMGIAMGITGAFQYAAVHAHLNLLGWVSLALIALIYREFPRAASSALAHWHFWLHGLGLPVFMISLWFKLAGRSGFEPGIVTGASVTFAGLLVFVVNLFLHARPVSEAAS